MHSHYFVELIFIILFKVNYLDSLKNCVDKFILITIAGNSVSMLTILLTFSLLDVKLIFNRWSQVICHKMRLRR